jgi:hypothetical protein
MAEKDYFYLLKGSYKGDTVYAQVLNASGTPSAPSVTYRAEYASRFLTYSDAETLRNHCQTSGNFTSTINWEIVKYLMDKEQLSWAAPRGYAFPIYENLLNKE